MLYLPDILSFYAKLSVGIDHRNVFHKQSFCFPIFEGLLKDISTEPAFSRQTEFCLQLVRSEKRPEKQADKNQRLRPQFMKNNFGNFVTAKSQLLYLSTLSIIQIFHCFFSPYLEVLVLCSQIPIPIFSEILKEDDLIEFQVKQNKDYQQITNFLLIMYYWCQNFSMKNKKNSTRKQIDKTHTNKKQCRSELEVWETWEVKKIFHLHHQYGPQWKLLAQEFSGRSANSIKNRFYTFLRQLLKQLFKNHEKIPKKLPHEIPSKTINKIYEAKEQFSLYKGLLKKISSQCQFNLQQHKIRSLSQKFSQAIHSIFFLIYKTLEQNIELDQLEGQLEDQFSQQRPQPQGQEPPVEPNDEVQIKQNQHQFFIVMVPNMYWSFQGFFPYSIA